MAPWRHPIAKQPLHSRGLGEPLHLAIPQHVAVDSHQEDASSPWHESNLGHVGLEGAEKLLRQPRRPR